MGNEKQKVFTEIKTEIDVFLESIRDKIETFKEIFPHLQEGIRDGLVFDVPFDSFKEFVKSDLFWESLTYLKDNQSFLNSIKCFQDKELIKKITVSKVFEGSKHLSAFKISTYDAPWPLYMYLTQLDVGFLHPPETPREFWKDYEKRLKGSLKKLEVLNNSKQIIDLASYSEAAKWVDERADEIQEKDFNSKNKDETEFDKQIQCAIYYYEKYFLGKKVKTEEEALKKAIKNKSRVKGKLVEYPNLKNTLDTSFNKYTIGILDNKVVYPHELCKLKKRTYKE